MDVKRRKYCSRQNKITVIDAQNIGRKSKYLILYERVSEGNWLFSEKCIWFSFHLASYNAFKLVLIRAALLCLTVVTKKMPYYWLSATCCQRVKLRLTQPVCCCCFVQCFMQHHFTKLKSDHSVFASYFEIIQSNINQRLHILVLTDS